MNETIQYETAAREEWPLRPWVLAGLGAIAGLAIWELLDTADGTPEPWRAAIAAFVFFAALATGFTLRPARFVGAGIFAVALGLVMGGVAYLALDAGDRLAGEEFAFAAGVFFSILAVPLFQSDFHRRRWATAYAEAHFHVWTDAISAAGALAFMLLSFALLWLLHGLFSLVGITIIEELIEDGWFTGMFFGAAFGTALGVLRNQLGIIGTLQRVVMLVFSLLAVPFAAAILVFLAILLFTGGKALWEATDAATPVLLACAAGCFVLANTVMRDDDASRSSSVVLQAAALALAFAIFPLTVFAAISMGVRIDQHGLSPERLWALVAIVIATAYGLAYWVGLLRGRLAGWAHYLRRANLHLAAATCVVALILALPLVDFGAISARNQLERLQAGEVSPQEFDFAALRWDFGAAGRRALERLAEGDGRVAELARAAQAQEQRSYGGEDIPPISHRLANLTGIPDDPDVNKALERLVREQAWRCQEPCIAIDLGETPAGARHVALVQGNGVTHLEFGDDGRLEPYSHASPYDELSLADNSWRSGSEAEVREIRMRRIFIDGRAVGPPFY